MNSMIDYPFKIKLLNYSDIEGGAGRAAYRIHNALIEAGVRSVMCVDSSTSGDWKVQGPTSRLGKGLAKLRPALAISSFERVFKTSNQVLHSASILPSGRTNALNKCDADLLHLNWVQGEMLSIAEIGRLRKPIVWTLHDMWAFCGAEHYTTDFRWREGYRRNNRPSYERGFDLNRWNWNRKCKHWKLPLHIVTPSQWLANCVRESALMGDWPVSVIPNPIDIERWQPIEQGVARELLGLPKDAPLLLFGAVGGGLDPRKGFDLLQAALQHLHGGVPELELVVFGQLPPKNPPNFLFPIHFKGHLHDDLTMRALYSAADIFALPSRQDNLPNTGVESLACGTPIVAFNIGGLSDIVEHKNTGYLAKPFDALDFAAGIEWILSDKLRLNNLRDKSRKNAVEKFSSKIIANKYIETYKKAIQDYYIDI